MSNSLADHPGGSDHNAIVIIDNEHLTRDCLAQAMRDEFPELAIIGVPTVRDLHGLEEAVVEGVLLKIQSRCVHPHDLARDVKLIDRYFAQVPVIVISPRDDVTSIEAAIAAGAQALIPLTTSFRIAVHALRLVLAGATYFPRPCSHEIRLTGCVLGGANGEAVTTLVDPLTPPALLNGDSQVGLESHDDTFTSNEAFTVRELQVLAALRLGRPNKWIAHALNLSENTIKIHVRNIMQKLHATNRTEAVILSQNVFANDSKANQDD